MHEWNFCAAPTPMADDPESRAEASAAAPFGVLAGAAALGLLLAGVSLGLLGPLGAVVFGLACVLSGFWLLLNRRSRASRWLATVLIFVPFVTLVVSGLRMIVLG
jgi:hypothetical protein